MPAVPDPPAAPAPAPPAPSSAAVWPLLALALVLVLPEAVLLGADHGLWGSRIWRPLGWQYGGFWAGLWRGWQPNYALQPYVMILSYSLLHAGPGHLIGNLAGFWAVAGGLRPRLGAGRILAVWAAGVLGGGLAFGALATSPAPMIGASGAVFGLVGAWWWADTARPGPPHRPWPRRLLRAAGLGLLLVAVNVAMYAASAAGVAWETHLGGFAAGAALAALLPARRAGSASGSASAAAPEKDEAGEAERQQRQ
jgi:membrane associated rhomboid family serine protease